MPAMCPDLFERLLLMTDLAVHPPKLNKVESRTSASGRAVQVKYWFSTMVTDLLNSMCAELCHGFH